MMKTFSIILIILTSFSCKENIEMEDIYINHFIKNNSDYNCKLKLISKTYQNNEIEVLIKSNDSIMILSGAIDFTGSSDRLDQKYYDSALILFENNRYLSFKYHRDTRTFEDTINNPLFKKHYIGAPMINRIINTKFTITQKDYERSK